MAENLNKIQGMENVGEDINLPVIVRWNSEKGIYSYKIKTDGNVKTKKVGTIEAEDVKNAPDIYYGKYVTNYTTLSDAGINAQNVPKWQIFLADDTNIFLIASALIHKDYAPFNYNTSTNYRMHFDNIFSLYDTNVAGNPSVAELLGKLSKQEEYHEWLNTPTNLKNNNNQKAVLSMLDTDKWSDYNDKNNIKRGFKNSDYADYVIGGPSLEMFCKSYNITHGGVDIIAKAKDSTGAYYNTGYMIKKGNDNENTWVEGLMASEQTPINTDVNKMLLESGNYWFASTSARNGTVVLNTVGNAIFGPNYEYTWYGFRPVVCLKSDVSLVEKTNGTTKTYELKID